MSNQKVTAAQIRNMSDQELELLFNAAEALFDMTDGHNKYYIQGHTGRSVERCEEIKTIGDQVWDTFGKQW